MSFRDSPQSLPLDTSTIPGCYSFPTNVNANRPPLLPGVALAVAYPLVDVERV